MSEEPLDLAERLDTADVAETGVASVPVHQEARQPDQLGAGTVVMPSQDGASRVTGGTADPRGGDVPLPCEHPRSATKSHVAHRSTPPSTHEGAGVLPRTASGGEHLGSAGGVRQAGALGARPRVLRGRSRRHVLEAGADPALPDAQGRNAWWYCRHLACAELLARRLPFDPAWRDARGGSPLHHLLTQAGRIDTHAMDLVRYWCEQGLDVNARDLQGDTALHLMARQYDSIHHRPSIECLLALGADWELPNRQGRTARQSLKKKHQAAWR